MNLTPAGRLVFALLLTLGVTFVAAGVDERREEVERDRLIADCREAP